MNNNYIGNLLKHPRKRFAKRKSADGVVDLSYLVKPLKHLTRHGRALNSAEEGDMHRMIGVLLATCVPKDATEADKENAIATLTIFVAIMMQKLSETCPDLCIEEFLADALEPDFLKKLSMLLAATPYVEVNGVIIPLLFREPTLFKANPITDLQRAGFRRRRIEPYEDCEMEFTIDLEDSLTDDLPNQNRRINLNDADLGELTADPFNGFDEFWADPPEEPDDFQ